MIRARILAYIPVVHNINPFLNASKLPKKENEKKREKGQLYPISS